MLDIILIIAAGISVAGQAALGLIVTTRPPPIERRIYFEIAFILLVVMGAVAVGVGAVRGLDSQSSLQTQVGTLSGTEKQVLKSNNFMSATIRGMADALRGVQTQINEMVKQRVAASSSPAPVIPPPPKVRPTQPPPQETGPQPQVQNSTPQVAHVQFVQNNIVSTSQASPYAAQVIIQTN